MSSLMQGADWVTTFEPYNGRMRKYRKLASQGFAPQMVQPEYAQIIEDGTNRMLKRIAVDPQELLKALN